MGKDRAGDRQGAELELGDHCASYFGISALVFVLNSPPAVTSSTAEECFSGGHPVLDEPTTIPPPLRGGLRRSVGVHGVRPSPKTA